MKKAIYAAAVLLGLATLSFAGTPANKTVKEESPVVTTSATSTGELYWYKVSYVGNPSGYIPSGAPLQAHDVKANVTADCEDGTTRDCYRGFIAEQPSGTTQAGDDAIQTDEQP